MQQERGCGMMFDTPTVDRRKRRCVCTACGWRGYQMEMEKMACPSCGTGYVAKTLPDNVPSICAACCHWLRNREFPNRFGVCKRDTSNHHPLSDHKTHELFGCIYHAKEGLLIKATL